MIRHALPLIAVAWCACPSEREPPPGTDLSRPQPIRPVAVVVQKDAGGPATPASPWPQARVGDRVEYAFTDHSSWFKNGGRVPQEVDKRTWTAHFALEVVRIEPQKVWLKLQVWRLDGPAEEWLLPVIPAAPPKLDGAGEPEEVKVGDSTVHCTKWKQDHRAGDGPLIEGCTTDEAALYLSGTVYRRTQGSGFMGGSYGGDLHLTAFTRGQKAEGGELPQLPVLFGAEGWALSLPKTFSEKNRLGKYVEERVSGRQLSIRTRGATLIQRTSADLKRSDIYSAGDRHFTLSEGLGETRELTEALTLLAKVPSPYEGKAAETGLHKVTVATVSNANGVYLADLLDPKLAGLPFGARAGKVADAEGELFDWGEGAMKPATQSGDLPEVLSAQEVHDAVTVAADDAGCGMSASPAGVASGAVKVTVEVPPTGEPKTKLEPPPHQKLPPAKRKCIEAALARLKLPPHTASQPPVVVDYIY